MNARLALVAVLGGAISVAAIAQDKAASAAPADAAALLQSCSAHKFETTVVATVDGKPRSQKVKICGVAGQGDAEWKRTLEDAIKKTATNDKMAASVKEQIVAALKLEIGRLDTGVTVRVAGGSTTLIAGLPDLAKSNPSKAPMASAPVSPLRPSSPPAPRSLEQDYGNLQPLPAPLPPAAVSAMAASVAAARPAMRLQCSTQFNSRAAECIDVDPGTVFAIRADENLPGDISLRFLRKGDTRGEVKLAALRQGQTVRVPLPSRVCTGVTRGRVEIQVMRPARGSAAQQVVDAYGPYELRC